MIYKSKKYCLFCFGIYRGLLPDSSLGPGVWSSYFPTPKPPGSNPPGISPTQDPGGPSKPPSLWRTKREELSLGTQAWGDITAGERKLRQLDQLCCLSSFPAPCLPKGSARVGHEFPSLEPRHSLVLKAWLGRGWKPRLSYTHYVRRHAHRSTLTQRHANHTETRSDIPETLGEGDVLTITSAQKQWLEKITQPNNWSQV